MRFFQKTETPGYFNREWLQKSFQKEYLQVPKIQTDLSAGRFFLSKSGESRKAPSVFSRPKQPFFSLFLGKKNKEKTKVEIRRAGWKSGQLNCRHPLSPPALTWRKSNYLAKKKTRARLTISQHFRGILEEYSRRYNGGEHTPFPYMRDKRVIISIITGFQDLFSSGRNKFYLGIDEKPHNPSWQPWFKDIPTFRFTNPIIRFGKMEISKPFIPFILPHAIKYRVIFLNGPRAPTLRWQTATGKICQKGRRPWVLVTCGEGERRKQTEALF